MGLEARARPNLVVTTMTCGSSSTSRKTTPSTEGLRKELDGETLSTPLKLTPQTNLGEPLSGMYSTPSLQEHCTRYEQYASCHSSTIKYMRTSSSHYRKFPSLERRGHKKTPYLGNSLSQAMERLGSCQKEGPFTPWLGASFSQSAGNSSDWPQTNILLDWSRCSHSTLCQKVNLSIRKWSDQEVRRGIDLEWVLHCWMTGALYLQARALQLYPYQVNTDESTFSAWSTIKEEEYV